MVELLTEGIVSGQAVIGVIGLGYVGLPLALEFCTSTHKHKVIGFDIDSNKVRQLLNGKSYVLDVSSDEVAHAVKGGYFEPTTDFDRLAEVDAVSICVPTPLRKTKTPDVSYILAAVRELTPRLHKPMLIILESTTYPGTTEELIGAAIQEAGYEIGKDVFLCFSPERVDPGNKRYVTKNIPKVIGGVTPECSRIGLLLYSRAFDKVITVSSARTAEFAKLLENTFRAVNIALVNEMALMCQRMDVDIWEAIDAAATKPFGYMPFYPGPGIGGHCIPLDPTYLAWKAKSYNFFNRFIELASDVNANMPYHVLERIAEVLNLDGKAISGSRIICLGLSYKKDTNDTRESPSLEIIKLLTQKGAEVIYNDPYIDHINNNLGPAYSGPISAETIGSADCVVLLTDHSTFDYEFIAGNAKFILDTRNGFKGIKRSNIFRLGSPIPTVKQWRNLKHALVKVKRNEGAPVI